MDKIIIVLLEASISFILFYGVYFFWLRKETFFKANRFYLLFTAVFSLLIPLLQFNFPAPKSHEIVVYNLLESITVNAVGYEQGIVQSISGWEWVSAIYLTGVLVNVFFLLFKTLKISLLKRKTIETNTSEITSNVCFVNADIYPFSFLNKIYVNPGKFSRQELDKIIAHENIHINQQHTYDCLFYELLIVFFWFHPIVYKYRTSAKVLHEYLADEGAIRSGISPISYQKLLFEKATGLKTVTLANSFNYSLVKRRLIMLTKNKSSKWTKMRLLYLAPVLLGLVLVFACNKTDEALEKSSKLKSKDKVALVAAEEALNGEKVFFEVEKMPEFDGGEYALRSYIAMNVKYPGTAKVKSIEGRVFVSFVVGKDGKVKDVKLVRGVHESLDNEAIRVISGLPDWTPGEQDGEPVNVSFTIPINFALN